MGTGYGGGKSPGGCKLALVLAGQCTEQKCIKNSANIKWVSSKESNAGLLAKEHTDKGHFIKLRGAAACARESIYEEGRSDDNESIADGDTVPASNVSTTELEAASWARLVKRSRKHRGTPGNVNRILKAASMMGGAKSADYRVTGKVDTMSKNMQ